MKITRIRVCKTHLPYVDGSYGWGAGNAKAVAQATVIVVDTNAGISGVGQFCQCGENDMVAHSEGVEVAAHLLAPRLLGEDPRQVVRLAYLGHFGANEPPILTL